MLHISSHVIIPDSEIYIHAMRSQGAGGQNVNKVSSAIHLQFDIAASSLPPFYKEELLTKGSKQRRLESKTKRGKLKTLRRTLE